MAYLGEEIKKLGFGLMRLPKKDGKIDLEATARMADSFIAKGFTYFDTAYVYDDGRSEEAAREVLVKRHPRESFCLATKLPLWGENPEEIKKCFYTSLRRTGAGYIDFYLLHSINAESAKKAENFGLWDFLKELKAKGLIRHMGFSFHDKADVLDDILTKHPEAEFVQLQINYSDWESDGVQSRKCYETARKHNKPIVIMEPVRGGSLATLPDSAAAVFKNADPKASTASWAIRFAASLEGVVTVLSGMSNEEQMNDNLSYMENFVPLSDEERKVIEKVNKIMEDMPQVPCTGCRYCIKGCPKNIPINEIFSTLNFYEKYNNLSSAKHSYNMQVGADGRGSAADCIKCRKCENICPQHIEITKYLERVKSLF